MLPVCLCRLVTQLVFHAVSSVRASRFCLSVETEDTFPLAEKVRAFLTDPFALLAAAPMAVATTAVPVAPAAPAKTEGKEASERSCEDMGFGL